MPLVAGHLQIWQFNLWSVIRDTVSLRAGKCAVCAKFGNKALANENKRIKKKEIADNQ